MIRVAIEAHVYGEAGSGRKGRSGSPGTRHGPEALYQIQVGSSGGHGQWCLYKSFKEFAELKGHLEAAGVEVKSPFPRGRHMGHENVEKNVVAQRAGFGAYLQEVVTDHIEHASVQEFIELEAHPASRPELLSQLGITPCAISPSVVGMNDASNKSAEADIDAPTCPPRAPEHLTEGSEAEHWTEHI